MALAQQVNSVAAKSPGFRSWVSERTSVVCVHAVFQESSRGLLSSRLPMRLMRATRQEAALALKRQRIRFLQAPSIWLLLTLRPSLRRTACCG